MSAARSDRTASVRPGTRTGRGTANEAAGNAEHLFAWRRAALLTNATIGRDARLSPPRLRPGSRAGAADRDPGPGPGACLDTCDEANKLRQRGAMENSLWNDVHSCSA